MCRLISLSCLVGLVLLACTPATAQTTSRTVALEPFEYPVGPVAGRGGGSGFASPWTGAGEVTAPTLEWPEPGGFRGTGNKLTTGGGDAGAFRTLSGRYGEDGTAVFVRFLVRGRPTGEQPDYGGISLMDGNQERLFVGKPAGSPNYGFRPAGQEAVFPAQQPVAANSQTMAYLCEIYFGLGTTPGNEQVYLSPEPALRSAAVAAVRPRPDPPPWVARHLDVPDFRFDTLRIQSGGGAGTIDIDEIRVQLIVAEPAMAASILSLAGLCALRRRR